MPVTFSVLIDTSNNGTYSTDVSSYIHSINWQLGFSNPYDPVCRDSTATITLRNDGQKFSPESASVFSGLTKDRRVKITSNDGVTTRNQTIVIIDDIKPLADINGTRIAYLYCSSFVTAAQSSESFVPVQVNVTSDVALSAVLNNGAVYPPGMPQRWQLGVNGQSELDSTTILGATTDYLIAETGKATFGYIGDNWEKGVSVLGAIRDVCGREYGRFFLDRSGLCNFYNRSHFITSTAVIATFSNTMIAVDYDWGKEVINSVKVKSRTRKVGVSPEVLARLDNSTLVLASTSFTIGMNYADLTSSGARIGGMNLIPPVRTTDFTANSAADGTGSDYTSSVSTTISEKGSRVEVTFTNAATVDVYIQAGAQVRGTAIRDFGEVAYTSNNTSSQSLYRYKPYTYNFETDNVADAIAIADYIASSRGTPRGQAKSITVDPNASAALLTQCLPLTIGDRVTVTESQTNSATDYFIISETHSMSGDVNTWRITYGLEPAGAYLYWNLGVVGFSELDTTTVLSPL